MKLKEKIASGILTTACLGVGARFILIILLGVPVVYPFFPNVLDGLSLMSAGCYLFYKTIQKPGAQNF